MSVGQQEIAEYLEYKITRNDYSDREYGLYIEFRTYGDEVWKWKKNEKYIKYLIREMIKDSYV